VRERQRSVLYTVFDTALRKIEGLSSFSAFICLVLRNLCIVGINLLWFLQMLYMSSQRVLI
jgi:hypothetical protein